MKQLRPLPAFCLHHSTEAQTTAHAVSWSEDLVCLKTTGVPVDNFSARSVPRSNIVRGVGPGGVEAGQPLNSRHSLSQCPHQALLSRQCYLIIPELT